MVFIAPSHHSPTNVTMPIERRLALLDAALKRDFVIFEGLGAYSTVTNTRFNGFGELTLATVLSLRP